ncbi:MAG: hypothetical protein ACOX8L_01900 [Candidatus Methanomethylophilaceae archaeon]
MKRMWLIVTTVAAMLVTAGCLFSSEKYRFGPLAIALWGLAVCIFVDHVGGFLMEGGEFFEISSEAFVLSIAMLIPVFAIWEAYVFFKNLKTGKISVTNKKTAKESV